MNEDPKSGQGRGLDGVPRLVSAEVEASLARFDDPRLLAAGKVNLISLEAVEKRLGKRWAVRRDQVYDFTTRVLERGVGAYGFFLRVSPTDFFVVHPEEGRVAGQAACLRYLREVLQHFLGEDTLAAAGVFQVTRIAAGRLDARRIEPGMQGDDGDDGLEMAEASAGAERRAGAEAGTDGSAHRAHLVDDLVVEAPVDRWTPFFAIDGRQLRVSATLEPILELKGFTRIGFRMARRVIVVATEEELSPRQVASLSTADILRVDLATIARGLGRIRAESQGEQQLSLVIPISFISLSSQRGRAELGAQLKAAGSFVKLGVICEICDIEGVPASALFAVSSLVRPFALLVAGTLVNPAPSAFPSLRGSGLQALSFEAPQGLGDAQFLGWARAAITAAKGVAKSVLVYRVDVSARAATLAALGATHVGFAD